MSTEEAELTFIRCPSCRSLVPAVASRCRMCGHNFMEAKQPQTPPPAKQGSSEETSIQPVSDLARQPEESISTKPSADRIHESITLAPLDFGGEETVDEADLRRPLFRALRESEPLREESEIAEPDTELSAVDSDASAGHATSGVDGFVEAVRKRKRRKRKKKPAQNFSVEGQSITDNTTARETKMENYSTEAKPQSPTTSSYVQNGVAKNLVPKVEREGVLVGWFVNYAVNQGGISQEIRSGQFFIGRQRLRDSDLIVPDDSISTPHLLVRAGEKGGIVVQDLLSEEGTYLRRVGEAEFVKCEEITPLNHGDTLRIGRYEVLVSLLPKR